MKKEHEILFEPFKIDPSHPALDLTGAGIHRHE